MCCNSHSTKFITAVSQSFILALLKICERMIVSRLAHTV